MRGIEVFLAGNKEIELKNDFGISPKIVTL